MEHSLHTISELGILPVVCPPDVESAEPLADALCNGGLPAIEITLRASWAMESIRRIHAAFPSMVIGAGTVFRTEQVDEAVKAGASFIVAPGLDLDIVRHCQARSIPVVPGCATPSDMTAGVKCGLKTLKFFPAEVNGGCAALKLLHGPFADCSFVPTGGLNLDNIGGYLDLPFVAACGGSFVAPGAELRAGNYDKITSLCRKACEIAIGLSFSHVELGTASAEKAIQAEKELAQICPQAGGSGMGALRWMGGEHSGTGEKCGKIVFKTRSVARALLWYARQNMAVDEEDIRRGEDGRPVAFMLPRNIEGMRVEITG